MITEIWKVIKVLITLFDDLQKYQAEIKEIRQDLRDLTIITHALAQEIKHSKEHAQSNHENSLLQLENRLLRIEKGLPSFNQTPAQHKKGTSRKRTSKKI